jgi:hypothetical protein
MLSLDEIMNEIINPKKYLPENPKAHDLLPYLSGRMKTKRLRKKFISKVDYYVARDGFVLSDVRCEWHWKKYRVLGTIFADEIYSTLGRQSFCSGLLVKHET